MLLCFPSGSRFCLLLVSPGPSSQLPQLSMCYMTAFHSHAILGAAFGTSSINCFGLASPGVCPLTVLSCSTCGDSGPEASPAGVWVSIHLCGCVNPGPGSCLLQAGWGSSPGDWGDARQLGSAAHPFLPSGHPSLLCTVHPAVPNTQAGAAAFRPMGASCPLYLATARISSLGGR